MLSATHEDECALVLNTVGLKPFSRVAVIPIDESEVPPDFHRVYMVYMVYKKAEYKNLALERFIEFVAEAKDQCVSSEGEE